MVGVRGELHDLTDFLEGLPGNAEYGRHHAVAVMS